ncbi:NAD(P)-dependent oxidoreductase [Haloprofundus sp. MHR1]|uniref:NAD-dependent epimerase/dehydratase family protein n=1 Tax=Haloprofundus sp. MHR1 TaxID=2572921 RepID=UPI0010BE8451|nr:NAD(P)-dependent oxidoreductase [Haloprofundus sp. MHR1]QCJ47369.1 NAD(P)-dependent oxidoreductase [Haloprofundus sp. MHR1]
MTNVAITGAAGNVGREALRAFEDTDHEVTAITHREHDDLDSVVLDVTDAEAFSDALAGQDVLVHLAANPSPTADWEGVFETNIDGTRNAYEAAVENSLDRVVFASSNHAVHQYNVDDPDDPESMTDRVRTVRPDDPTLPDSFYGVSKVSGEALGQLYAARHDVDVVNLRIGWLLEPDDLRERNSDPEVDSQFLRAMWLSPDDCRRVVRDAVTASLDGDGLGDTGGEAVTAHGVSANDDRYLSLTETRHALDYRPRDNSAAELDG